MQQTSDFTAPIDLALEDGTIIKIETSIRGKEDVSLKPYPIEEICQTIEGIAKALFEMLKKSKASKSTVKFGIEVAIESGQLTALIVKGSTKGNLEITLEWDNTRLNHA